jgi:dipeptidyl aminopeptidase/acylaminoacyl peptidase
MHNIAPYGSWKSPISADLITSTSISIMSVLIDGDDIYWIESRPLEGGRHTIMRRQSDGEISECTPADFYVRTTVHEYGGGAFTVADGNICFANFKDQRLYRHRFDEKPMVLTPGNGYRYADMVLDRARHRLICIREDHACAGEAVNTIVGVSLGGNDNGRILVQGNDFYSSARLSPDGNRIAYLTWNHPNMPWDGCELWVADVKSDGEFQSAQLVAGGKNESVFQPEWSPDGVLHFVAEGTGWWNIYRWKDGTIEPLCSIEAEFGKPQWGFALSTYDFATPTKILACYSKDGISNLAWLDPSTERLTKVNTPYTDIAHVRCGKGFAVFIAGSPLQPPTVVRLDTQRGTLQTIRTSVQPTVESGYLSIAQTISFATGHGQQSHGNYYPPTNKDFAAPTGELPPLLVISHGGPTSFAGTTLNCSVQYWTSRGFAVLDVNYGGSTGYGRDYRRRLNGQWGIVDVDDCCNGALYLVDRGLADSNRLSIRGGSAGGYTTLASLTSRSQVFKAGASHYGLAELGQFIGSTHKFESRYLFSLIGPYPERKDLYQERSPMHSTQNLTCPLILFQGDEDRVVPPSQSLMMFEAARAAGVPVAYLLFQGEQHGFRRAENIKRALEAELYFYSRIFGFELAEPVEPVKIENL